MRKDGKSQYQIKKEKLLKIKSIIKNMKLNKLSYYEEELRASSPLNLIWEIVKDEKDND